MIKNLRFLFLSMLMVLGGVAMADNVTVTFEPGTTKGNNTSASGEDSMTKDGITISTTSGGLAAAEYRFAKSSVTTIASTVGNITKIEFTCTASGTTKYGPGCFDEQDGYSYEGSNGVWTGNAASVSFTAKTAQVRATKIVVTVGEGSGEPSTEPTDPTEDPSEPTEPTIDGGTTPETAITVERALEFINALADGAKSSDSYYIKGTVTVAEVGNNGISTKYHNATFNMGDLVVYRAKGLKQGDITTEDYVKVGDEVVVYGQLQKYVKDGETTPEVAQGGYIYSINGKTEDEEQPTEPVTFVGDGTKDNPYTVADLKAMTDYPTDNVWVKGIIIGTAKSGSALNDEDVVSNIAIAATASDTEFIPVELKNKTDFRTNLNLVDNPDNKGKEVLLYGQITSYFSTTGVKNLVDAILDGETVTGISNIKADTDVNAPIYNMAGQRVAAGFKGVVVKNGRKVVVK